MKKKILPPVMFVAGGFLLTCLFCFLFIKLSPYKDLEDFQNRKISTRILDCNGELIQVLAVENGVRREFTPLERIPQEVIEAFIQAEDKRFFLHHGVDLQAVFRALKSNVSENRTVSGASTITMQLARIITPSSRRNIPAKIKESWNAIRLETRLSKKQILEMYLNNVPFGFNTEGVTSAAFYFFGKSLENLSWEEIEILSKIPRRPANYSYLSGKTEYPFFMPHYVEYLKTIPELGLYKKSEIKLPASLAVQKRAEYLLESRTRTYADNRLTNGAVLAIDLKTGAVLAWAGSSSFEDEEHSGQIDGVLVKNQPGSSMKPFLYSLALERGYAPSDVLPDIPKEFGFDALYVPQNFNNRYNGPVRFRIALASSLNVPAVYLLNEIGIENYRKRLFELGFNSLEGQDTGLSLALGGAEVSLLELVQGFSVFPRDGRFVPVSPMGTKDAEKKSVYAPDTARLMCSILSDEAARVLGFGYSEVFKTDFDSIFKTGTANQFQNITALAASGRYAVGVWMGNFSGETVIGKTGSSIPASIAKEILVLLENDGKKSIEFKKPDGFRTCKICSLSGMKAGSFCQNSVTEFVENNTELNECTWHTEQGTEYPAEFASWFILKDRAGFIGENNGPLKIVTPRNNSILFYDSLAASKGIQKLTVEVSGGKEKICRIYVDGQLADSKEEPFVFNLDLERGNHFAEVVCGEETDGVFFSVK